MLWAELKTQGKGGRLAGLLSLGFVQSGMAVGYVLLVRAAFDGSLNAGGSGAPSAVLAAGLVAATLGGAWLRRVERARAERLGHELVAGLRTRLFEHATRVDPAAFRRFARGGLFLRFTGDLEPLRRWLVVGVVRLPIATLSLTAALGALSLTAPRLALAVALVVLLGTAVSAALGPRLDRAIREQRRRRSKLASNVSEKLEVLALMRASGRGPSEVRRVARQGEELAEAGSSRAEAATALRFVSQATVGLSAVVALVLGLHEVAAGRATPGDVVASTTLLGLLAPPVRELARAFEARAATRVTLEKLGSFLAVGVESRMEVVPPATCQEGELEVVRLPLGGGRYLDRTFEPGTTIALVGPNGAGKSTLARALAGIERPREGAVRFGGRPLYSLGDDERSELVGVAAPDLPLVQGSLSKNVRYRRRKPRPGEVEEALAISGAATLVDVEGLDRRVREFGRGLSDGERTRIALARAVLGPPALLVLDEVEAHLDAATNASLLEWLSSFGGVAVVATHDPDWIAAADEVIEIEPLGSRRRRPFAPTVAAMLALAASPATVRAQEDEKILDPTPIADQQAEGEVVEPWFPVVGAPQLGADDWYVRLRGRVHLDYADFSSDEQPQDSEFDFRRGRIALTGRFGEHWRARLDYDALGPFEGWRGVFVRWQDRGYRVAAGNLLPPFGFEERVSSNLTTFQERSLISALTPGFMVGTSVSYSGGRGGVEAGIYTDPIDGRPVLRGEGVSVAARGFYPLLQFDGDLPGQLHVAASFEHRVFDSGEEVRLRARPEARFYDLRLVDTGNLDGVDSSTAVAGELALDLGPAALQSEYVARGIDGAVDANFSGGYVQLSGFVTGEHRRYSRTRGVARSALSESAWGAVELAARFSWIDLTDGAVEGGEQENVSLGLNWHPGQNWRISLQHVSAAARPDRFGNEVDLEVVQARLQFTF